MAKDHNNQQWNIYNNQHNTTKQALQHRLDEAQALLKTLKDQQVHLQDDLLDLMDRHQAEIIKSRQNADNEMQCYRNSVHFYTTLLDGWLSHKRSVASAELNRRQTWWYQFLMLLAALVGATSFLMKEKREREKWQKQAIQPLYGEEQREWQRLIIDAQRHIERIQSYPQQTPKAKQLERDIASLRQRLHHTLDQIALQETRVNVLQTQLATL